MMHWPEMAERIRELPSNNITALISFAHIPDNTTHPNLTFQSNSTNSRKSCEISSKLRIKAPELRQCHSDFFTDHFEHISHPCLVFVLLNLSKFLFAFVNV